MTGFAALIAASQGAHGLVCNIPDEWRQGRTVYGGLTTAIAYNAARVLDTGLATLRCAQFAFVKPVGTSLEATATVLGRGKSSTFAEARVVSDGQVALLGTFLFLTPRESSIEVVAPTMPTVQPPEQAAAAMRGKAPAYCSRLEYRHAGGVPALGKSCLLRWVRLRERAGIDVASELLLIGDALPAAVVPLFQTPPFISSATWSVHIHGAAPAAHDGWWLLQAEAESASGGVSCQRMTVWNRAGDAIVSATQTVTYYAASG